MFSGDLHLAQLLGDPLQLQPRQLDAIVLEMARPSRSASSRATRDPFDVPNLSAVSQSRPMALFVYPK